MAIEGNVIDENTGFGVDATAGPIRAAVSAAEVDIDALEKRVGELGGRLGPVLGPGTQDKRGPDPGLEAAGSQLAGHIRTVGHRIREVTAAVGEILDRLEV